MTERSKLNRTLFRVVSLGFCLAMLILTLLLSIKLAIVSDGVSAMQQELYELEDTNKSLRVRCESRLSLEELERYALEELGMQRLHPGQIIYLELG